MSVLREFSYAVKVALVFVGVALLSLITSCDSPTMAMSEMRDNTVSINIINHISYDTVTVMHEGVEWAMYEVFLKTSYFSEEDYTMHYERHDTISIDVPNTDAVTIYTHFQGEMIPNAINVVADSCYSLKIN